MNTVPEAKFNLSAWALKNQQMVSFFHAAGDCDGRVLL